MGVMTQGLTLLLKDSFRRSSGELRITSLMYFTLKAISIGSPENYTSIYSCTSPVSALEEIVT